MFVIALSSGANADPKITSSVRECASRADEWSTDWNVPARAEYRSGFNYNSSHNQVCVLMTETPYSIRYERAYTLSGVFTHINDKAHFMSLLNDYQSSIKNFDFVEMRSENVFYNHVDYRKKDFRFVPSGVISYTAIFDVAKDEVFQVDIRIDKDAYVGIKEKEDFLRQSILGKLSDDP